MSSRVSNQARHTPACTATEASWSLEISAIESRDIILSKQRTTKAQIRLRIGAVWSAPLLFAYDIRHVFSWPGSNAIGGISILNQDINQWQAIWVSITYWAAMTSALEFINNPHHLLTGEMPKLFLICLYYPRYLKLQLDYNAQHRDEWSEMPHDKTNKIACVPSEDSDQPGHPPSLIRVFPVCMKKAWVLSYPLSAQWRLIRPGGCTGWSDSSLGAHAILLVLSWGRSCCTGAHEYSQCFGMEYANQLWCSFHYRAYDISSAYIYEPRLEKTCLCEQQGRRSFCVSTVWSVYLLFAAKIL